MKLKYYNSKENSCFVLTNFICSPSIELLKRKDLYKILWCKSIPITITIDGYKIELVPGQIVFCTPLNIISLPRKEGLMAIVFNREFYCIRDHDDEVSCNGFLFFGSSEAPVISLNKKEQKSFESIFIILEDEFETKDHIQGEMLRVMLKRLLIKSSRLIKDKYSNPEIPNNQLDLSLIHI